MAALQPAIGIILAGGLSRRMGRNKALVELQGKTLLARAIERLAPQVAELLISSNEALAIDPKLHQLGDSVPGYAGPLAGILTGLEWLARQRPTQQWLLSVAVDTPFFPLNLGQELQRAARPETRIVTAASAGRAHPTCALWHIELLLPLRQFLLREQQRRMLGFQENQVHQRVEFPLRAIDPFFNINCDADLALATAGLCQGDTPYLE